MKRHSSQNFNELVFCIESMSLLPSPSINPSEKIKSIEKFEYLRRRINSLLAEPGPKIFDFGWVDIYTWKSFGCF